MSKHKRSADAALAVITQDPSAMQARIYQAILIQRPVVLEYLRALRRDKPDATAAEILRELERRYVRTVTIASTGVGASAAIPAVGIPMALGLGVADLLFFYETSALYVLAAAELHGIEVADASRARPLVFGMLMGEKSQSKITTLVLQAAGAGGVNTARAVAKGKLGKALPSGWGEVLTEQLPDSALAPLATVMARQALRMSARFGTRTLGKVIPFGVGAVIGGVGSFTFGRDVVKAARIAFPKPPVGFPEVLRDFAKPTAGAGVGEPSRAAKALESASGGATEFGEVAWDKSRGVAGAGARAVGGGARAVGGGARAVGGMFRRKK